MPFPNRMIQDTINLERGFCPATGGASMKPHLIAYTSIILLIIGCASSQQLSQQIEGPLILGSLDLTLELNSAQYFSYVELKVNVNLENQQWQDITLNKSPVPCTYSINGRSLQLTMVEEPLPEHPKTMGNIIRRIVSIQGDFRQRGEDYVAGPFEGAVAQIITYRIGDEMNWTLEEEQWQGLVKGVCIMGGNPVERLPLIFPDE